jgi:hypothetical protein
MALSLGSAMLAADTNLTQERESFDPFVEMQKMHQEMDMILPPKGLVEVLTKIHKSGRYHMDILTSNRPKNVHRFLAKHQIDWFARMVVKGCWRCVLM